MKKVMWWFRDDLRLEDQPLIAELLLGAEAFLPVYVFDPRQYAILPGLGFPKTGPYRARFIWESVMALRNSLQELGSDLYIVSGLPEIEIPRLSEQWDPDIIGFEKGVAPEEIQVELALFEQVQSRWFLKSQFSKSLLHPLDLPFSMDSIPQVFTAFRKRVEKDLEIRPTSARICALPKWPAEVELPTISNTEMFGGNPCSADERAVWNFKGGEEQGLSRLSHYFSETKAVSYYKQRRNALMGEENSSKFSPWLAVGALSPRRVYQELRAYEAQYGATEDTYWLFFELLWRDFFRWIMFASGDRMFTMNGLTDNPQPAVPNKDLFMKWIRGETGDTFVDANMHELNATGFMSNRGRQNVASHFCHTLKLPWIWGAAYFEHALIDYDVCSNWGNWAYLAGVGNDPRQGRVFNTQKQAEYYDPNGEYINRWK